MGVLAKDVQEEGGAGRENHLKINFEFPNLAHLHLLAPKELYT